MSAPRLRLLCPRLVRRVSLKDAPRLSNHPHPRRRDLHSAPRLADSPNQRYGTANEPPAHLGGAKPIASPDSNAQKEDAPALPPPDGPDSATKEPTPRSQPASPLEEARATQGDEGSAQPVTSASLSPQSIQRPLDGAPMEQASPTANDATTALSSILAMEPPMLDSASESHPPHLQAPRYVHHFDTYSFIKALQAGGSFTEAQSSTMMKAIRSLLADNMDLAREGIVSRGDAEMDAYQFRAASSELRTEMRQRRAAADERYRADRVLLQNEADTLAQRITQESLNLKDELKGMFDDRKMAVRAERRSTDNRIQELGYKITVAMNSGMRNEIEGLRFILTRRTVLALTLVVIMSLAALRLATYSNKKEDGKDKHGHGHKTHDSDGPGVDGASDSFSGGQTPSELSSAEIARRVQRGDNPALASLA